MATISKTGIDFLNIKGTSSQLDTLKTLLKTTEAALFTNTDTKRLYFVEYNQDAVRLGSNVDDVTLTDAGLLTIKYIDGSTKQVNLAIDGALDDLKTTILNTVSSTYATKGELSAAQTTLQGNIDGKVAKVAGADNNIVFFGADGAIKDKSTKVVTSVGATGADTALPTEKAVRTAIKAVETGFSDYQTSMSEQLQGFNNRITANEGSIETINLSINEIGPRVTTNEDAIDSLDEALKNVYTKSEVYTKTETDNQISNKIAALGKVFEFKGTKATYADLPTTANENGDVWQVTTAGTTSTGAKFEANTEFYWDGDKWEILGVNQVDMSNYYTKGDADDKFATTSDLASVNDAVSTKLGGTNYVKDEILIWGSDMVTVSGSGKKFSSTVANDATTVPTGAAITTALTGKIDKVASPLTGSIPTLQADGSLKNGTVKICEDASNTEADASDVVGTMEVVNEFYIPRVDASENDIVVFNANRAVKDSGFKIVSEKDGTVDTANAVYTGELVEALIAEVKTKWYEIK